MVIRATELGSMSQRNTEEEIIVFRRVRELHKEGDI